MFKIQFKYKGKWVDAKKEGFNSFEEANEAFDQLFKNIKLLDKNLGMVTRSVALRIINITCKVKFITPDPVVRMEVL